MKLLTKTLMALALIGTCNVWGDPYPTEYGYSSEYPTNQYAYGGYRRVILLAKDRPWYQDTDYADPNHSEMRKSGLYTEGDICKMTTDGLERLVLDYGFDFRTKEEGGNPNVTIDAATGRRTLPGVGIFYPYVYGISDNTEDTIIISDTAHPERSHTAEWYELQFGEICIFLNTVVVPDVVEYKGALIVPTYAGATCNAGDGWFFADHNNLKFGTDHQRPDNREILLLRTSSLARGKPNQNGKRHAQVLFDVFDEQGRQGLWISASGIPTRQIGAFDGPLIETRPVITWDIPANYNTYSPSYSSSYSY